MTIKENQIVTQSAKKKNPVSSFPRDVKMTTQGIVNDSIMSSQIQEEVAVPPESIDSNVTPPPVPTVLSIKSQTVLPKSDGTFSVSVVLDVSGLTSEYDVRISNAG